MTLLTRFTPPRSASNEASPGPWPAMVAAACVLATLPGCCTVFGWCPPDDRESSPPALKATYECVYRLDGREHTWMVNGEENDLSCDTFSRDCTWSRPAAENVYDLWGGVSMEDARWSVGPRGIVVSCMASCGRAMSYPYICRPPDEIHLHSVDSSPSRGALVASRTSRATFSGALWTSHPDLRVHVRSDHSNHTVSMEGEIAIEGGDCPYASCPVEVTLLNLRSTAGFSVHGVSVSELVFLNNGHWAGTKLDDETFSLDRGANLALRAVIDGQVHRGVLTSAEPVFGNANWTADNPQGAPYLALHTVFRGNSADGPLTISLDLFFEADSLAPTADFAVVAPAHSNCPASQTEQADGAIAILDARQSKGALSDVAIVSYAWYDGKGDLMLRTSRPCLGVRHCAVAPIRLVVTDERGSTSEHTNGKHPVLGDPGSFERFGDALATGDFDGDGYDDVAVGVPGDNGRGDLEEGLLVCGPDPDTSRSSGDAIAAGGVQVLYGGPWGITATRNQLWHQDREAVPGVRENGDRFGQALATGDFDADGRQDLAVGVPADGTDDAGSVNLFYGSAVGLSMGYPHATRNLRQGASGASGDPESGDGFGSALATGDFNGDGFGDLAVGIPGDSDNDGAVQVFFGGESGLGTSGNQVLPGHGPTTVQRGGRWAGGTLGTGVGSGPVIDEPISAIAATRPYRFGAALAVADWDRDGYSDIAIGAPGSRSRERVGSVHVFFGSAHGLDSERRWFVDQRAIDAEAWGFGWSLAAGRISPDEFADLVISSPDATVAGKRMAGMVVVLKGSEHGFSADRVELLHQDSGYPTGVHLHDYVESYDRFGYALAVGSLNDDPWDDLIVGVPREDVTIDGVRRYNMGVAHVVYASGRDTGLFNLRLDQRFYQSNLQGNEESESGDMLGRSLAVGDLDNNGFDDLIMGSPGEDLGPGATDAGMIHVLLAEDFSGGLVAEPPLMCSPVSPAVAQHSEVRADPDMDLCPY